MTLSKHYQFSLSKQTWATFYAIFHIASCQNMCSPRRTSLCAEMMPTRQFLHPLFCINIGYYFHHSPSKIKNKSTKTFKDLCLQTYNFRIQQRWLSSCPATRELHLLICFLPLHMWIFLFSYHHSHWQWGWVRPFLSLKMQAVKSLHLNHSTYSQPLVPGPANYKENKKNLSQLIWMSKQSLTAGLSDSHLLTAAQ